MPTDRLASIAEADQEYARNVGAQQPDRAWILSDRDVWYRNPAYTGPAVRHPEADDMNEGLEDTAPAPTTAGAQEPDDFLLFGL